MRNRTIRIVLSCGALSGGLLVGASAQAPDPRDRIDPRSHELLRVHCASLLAEREVTLFGNGTLRLRRTEEGEKTLELAELPPEDLASYRRQLEEETAERPPTPRKGPGGEWVEQCELTVDTSGRSPTSYRFSRVDALPLDLSRLVKVGDALFAEVELRGIAQGFPPGYSPRVGDVVLRADGNEFEVRRFTSDGRGVELQGIEQPLIVYVAREEIPGTFAGLVRRRR